MMFTDKNNPHLGGYIEGGDPATWYPTLWQWLVEEADVRSVVDVGCGEGQSTVFFDALHIEAVGIDGVVREPMRSLGIFSQHDYSKGPWAHAPKRQFDLCWSCEFVEHVEEEYMPNFLETFSLARLVLMTHAEPWQNGYHHVNCQPAEYWKGAMAGMGYTFDPTFTAKARLLAEKNTDPYNHFKRSGLAFLRNEKANS